MTITDRLAARSGDATDSAILAMREKADRAYARHTAICAAATCTAEEIANEREGSEADNLWEEFSAAEMEIIGLPASTARGVLAKLEIAVKLMDDDRLVSEPGLSPVLRGGPDDYLDLRDRAVISAVRDLARMCGADPVPATLRCREKKAPEVPAPVDNAASASGAEATGKAAMLATDLQSSLDTLSCDIDTLAEAARTLGCTMGAVDHPATHGAANLFHAAALIMEKLHRDVAMLIEDADRLRQAVHGQEGGAA